MINKRYNIQVIIVNLFYSFIEIVSSIHWRGDNSAYHVLLKPLLWPELDLIPIINKVVGCWEISLVVERFDYNWHFTILPFCCLYYRPFSRNFRYRLISVDRLWLYHEFSDWNFERLTYPFQGCPFNRGLFCQFWGVCADVFIAMFLKRHYLKLPDNLELNLT